MAIILSLKTPVSEASDQEPRHFIPVKLYYYEGGLSLINQALNRFWKLSEKPVFETVESMLGWRPNMRLVEKHDHYSAILTMSLESLAFRLLG